MDQLASRELSHQFAKGTAGMDGNALELPAYFARKVVFSRLFATALFIGFLPVMLLFMLLVRITSPGPALFRQTRLGKDGVPFEILKIRTMYCNAEDISGPMLCQPGDSRVTPIGRLMRFLHIDELPQLINVMHGEMCLVGPRPERPEIIAKHRLRERVPGFADRTQVRPGVTGLAQINLPADVTADCVIPKVRLDLEYIRSANAGLDLRILLCTALRMLGVRHGRAVRVLGLHRSIQTGGLTLTPADLTGRFAHHNGHAETRARTPRAPLALAAAGGDGSGSFSLSEMLDDEPESWQDRGDQHEHANGRKPR
jgi:lipopolysaccharide/colanic/teichoic acid biosynthesis glycosyltransferase